MTLAEEIQRIAEWIEWKFPGAVVHRFEEPVEPVGGSFAVLLKQELRRNDTLSHTLIERQYTIAGYGEEAEQVLLALEALGRSFMNDRALVPADLADTFRPVSFQLEAAEKREGGLVTSRGSVLVQRRLPVTAGQHEKIGKVNMRMKTN